jgi:2-C-methyl-D-erythritol 4-phosphate cytidylyltransferase
MGLWGIVVAGGSGTRFGTLKQLELLAGRRVLDWAVMSLAGEGSTRNGVDGVVLVVPEVLLDLDDLPGDVIVAGGPSRSASVRAGLAAVPEGTDRVLVHDGARPLASAAVVERVIKGLDDASAVVPVVPVTDTLRRVDGGSVDRSGLVAVQTPQGFDLALLKRAHDAGGDATDDASLVDALGEHVLHVPGDLSNIKITEPADLVVAETLLTVVSAPRMTTPSATFESTP